MCVKEKERKRGKLSTRKRKIGFRYPQGRDDEIASLEKLLLKKDFCNPANQTAVLPGTD